VCLRREIIETGGRDRKKLKAQGKAVVAGGNPRSLGESFSHNIEDVGQGKLELVPVVRLIRV